MSAANGSQRGSNPVASTYERVRAAVGATANGISADDHARQITLTVLDARRRHHRHTTRRN